MSRIGELQLDIDKTAGNVVQLLVSKGKKIACAESCTGGLISAAITSVSGSSAVMDMSICTYAISAKERFIGVPAAIIDKYGVVSAETAAAMAEGVRKTAGSNIGISVTGIAGPTGAEPGKPVGTVYIGLSVAGGVKMLWDKNRSLFGNLILLGILFLSFNTQNLAANLFFWLFPCMAFAQQAGLTKEEG